MMALTKIRHLGVTGAHTLYSLTHSATRIMECRKDIRSLVPDATAHLANIMAADTVDLALKRAEEEYEYDEQHHIQRLCLDDAGYPQLLRECSDAPLVLYYLGSADLNARHIVSIVGTRHITPYGQDICRDFIAGLHEALPDTLVVSGLAYGVDIHAHRASLAQDIPTVGVLAHGLDTIYPALHRDTAAHMVQQGGLLTEYMSCTRPDKGNFVRRNRIVAGMAHATVVVESAEKGGSLITARLAGDYERTVCAFPGRATDPYSKGCNHLIHSLQAQAVTSVGDFLDTMGWADVRDRAGKDTQLELFPVLSETEQVVCRQLEGTDDVSVNQLTQSTGLPFSLVSATLYDLEEKGIVRMVGGNRYQAVRHL